MMGRHARSRRRCKREDHVTARAEAALALARLGHIGSEHPLIFSARDLAKVMRGSGGSTGVIWEAVAVKRLAQAWWDGDVDASNGWTFMFEHEPTKTRRLRSILSLDELVDDACSWSPEFVQAVVLSCPYPDHAAFALRGELEKRAAERSALHHRPTHGMG